MGWVEWRGETFINSFIEMYELFAEMKEHGVTRRK